MLGPEHVGRRVVVRVRLADPAPGRRFSDVVGELIEIDPARMRVRPAAGAAVTIEARAVVAAKAVGPRPTPFSEIVRLERLLAASWPAVESVESHGWTLRYADGFSRRANSVVAFTEPDDGLDAALPRVREWYRRRGARALVSVPLPLARRLDGALAARGWTAEAEAAVLTRPLAPTAYDGEARIAHEPSPDLLAQVGRGQPSVAAAILGSGPDRAFAEIRRGGELVARGRAAIEDGTVVVSGVGTLPGHRRRGLGGQILAALTSWAAGAGADRVALQVETDNAAALAMYARSGFTERYRYWYRALEA